MKIATYLGCVPAVLLKSMQSRELTELIAYYDENKHWTEKLDFYFAQIAFMLYHANKAEDSPDKKLDDFYFEKPEREPMTAKQMEDLCRARFPNKKVNTENGNHS